MGKTTHMKYNLTSILMTSPLWAFSRFLRFALLTSFIVSSSPAFADDDAEIRSHINRGNALLGRRQFQEAINEYEAVLKIQPNYPVAKSNIALTHNNWGIYLYGLRRYAEAKEHWETALKLNPSDGHVIRNLKILETAMQRNPPPPAPKAQSDVFEGWSPFDALEREAEQKKASAAGAGSGTASGSGAALGSSGGQSNGSGGNSGSGTAGVFGTGFGGSDAAGGSSSATGSGAFGGTAGGSVTSTAGSTTGGSITGFGDSNTGSNQTATSGASKTEAPPAAVILSNTNAGISTSSATAATGAGTSIPSTNDGTSVSPFSSPGASVSPSTNNVSSISTSTSTSTNMNSNASKNTNVNFGTDPFQPREQNPAPSVRIVGGSMGGATIVGGSTVASGGKSFTPSTPVTANMPSNAPIAPVRIPAKPASGSVPMSWPGADETSKNEDASSKPTKKSDSSKNRLKTGSGSNNGADESENIEELLAKIENKVYGKISKNTPILKRLEKLEMDTSGKKNSGSVAQRLKELKDAYGI